MCVILRRTVGFHLNIRAEVAITQCNISLAILRTIQIIFLCILSIYKNNHRSNIFGSYDTKYQTVHHIVNFTENTLTDICLR